MLITQPRSKKNQNGPSTSLMGPGGAVWGKKTYYKKSRETVPLTHLVDHVLDLSLGGEEAEASTHPLYALQGDLPPEVLGPPSPSLHLFHLQMEGENHR